MRTHPRIGYDILKGSPSKYLSMGAIIALGHHEKYDGTGYPNGLHGEDIPIVARVVAVADVFDALVSERPYKHAWPMEEGVDYLGPARQALRSEVRRRVSRRPDAGRGDLHRVRGLVFAVRGRRRFVRSGRVRVSVTPLGSAPPTQDTSIRRIARGVRYVQRISTEPHVNPPPTPTSITC